MVSSGVEASGGRRRRGRAKSRRGERGQSRASDGRASERGVRVEAAPGQSSRRAEAVYLQTGNGKVSQQPKMEAQTMRQQKTSALGHVQEGLTLWRPHE